MSNQCPPLRLQPRPVTYRHHRLSVSLLLVLVLLLVPAMFGPALAASSVVEGGIVTETATSAVRDGDFDSLAVRLPVASSPWRFSSREPDRPIHLGRAGLHETAARLCGVPRCEDELSQVIDPPVGHGALTLVYSLRTETAKPPGNGCEDHFLVQVTVGNGPAKTVGRSCEEVEVSDEFAQHRIDITAMAAQAVQGQETPPDSLQRPDNWRGGQYPLLARRCGGSSCRPLTGSC